MKKIVFLGLFAFFVLMQTPFILSLDSDICDNVSKSYRSDCREIISLNLSDDDKLYLIDHLEDFYSVQYIETYPSPFSDNTQASDNNSVDYDTKGSLKNKFWLIFNLIVLLLFSCFYYFVLKKGVRRIKWTAE